MEWEVDIGSAKPADKMIFECLDGSFGCIYTVVMWFNELYGYVFAETILFDRRGRLVIRDIECWCVSVCCQCFYNHAEGVHDVFTFGGFDRDGKDVVGVVIVGDKDELLAVQRTDWEVAGAVGVECSMLFVR